MKIELSPHDIKDLYTTIYHDCKKEFDCSACVLEDFCNKKDKAIAKNIAEFLLQRGTCITNERRENCEL